MKNKIKIGICSIVILALIISGIYLWNISRVKILSRIFVLIIVDSKLQLIQIIQIIVKKYKMLSIKIYAIGILP